MTQHEQAISDQIWRMKYQLKTFEGKEIDKTVDDTIARVAKALSLVEGDEAPFWEKQFINLMSDFKFIPAGRINSGAGTGREVTLSNCFVMGTIPDSMHGIFDNLKEAALTMQQGGGIGYDFSTLRPKGAHVKGVDADASGPLTFMDVWDAMCRTVMSAGSRRGAMMATMRCDHPDIEAFIEAKRDPLRLRMFNMSVMVTDDFMEAVHYNRNFDLKFGGVVYKTISANKLWDKIMQSTYDYAEPGVLFIDRINKMHNLNFMEKISATNPCGEKPMAPYSSCLLGSMNLVKFVKEPFTPFAKIDYEGLAVAVRIAIRLMDNVIETTNYPIEKQSIKAKEDRQLGLGVTGVGSMMAMMNVTYGSIGSQNLIRKIMETINTNAYLASAYLAKMKGPFLAYDKRFLDSEFVKSVVPAKIKDVIRQYGIRNALLTSIAPTGTISLYANNVSSGIEPIFALEYERKILQADGTHTYETVTDYAVHLWRKLNPGVKLSKHFVTAQTITPYDHISIQAAAQEFVDSAISKTTNCPADISFEDFKNVYMAAYESGCKGCTTYRPNEVITPILTSKDEPFSEGGACYYDPETGSRSCSE